MQTKHNSFNAPILSRRHNGFTLIEILVVLGMIAILAAVVIIAINPARQFAQGRNTQRTSNVTSILNAIGQNMTDNKGAFNCSVAIPTSTAANISSTGGVNLMPCLAPTYLADVLVDPKTGSGNSTTTYDTRYTAFEDGNGRITIAATDAELGQTISVKR